MLGDKPVGFFDAKLLDLEELDVSFLFKMSGAYLHKKDVPKYYFSLSIGFIYGFTLEGV